MKSHENAIHLTGHGEVKWKEENTLKRNRGSYYLETAIPEREPSFFLSKLTRLQSDSNAASKVSYPFDRDFWVSQRAPHQTHISSVKTARGMAILAPSSGFSSRRFPRRDIDTYDPVGLVGELTHLMLKVGVDFAPLSGTSSTFLS
jgi:hypothetical protein